MTDRYVELHSRSAFSFLEGASSPESLMESCYRAQMPAIALLDRNGLYGSPKFYLAGKHMGIRAHVGAEVALTDGSYCPLLVKSRTGYQNLSRLITRIKLRSKKNEGAATYEELSEFAEGLICLTGGEDGPLAKALSQGRRPAINRYRQLADIFGKNNLYGEIQRHHDRAEEARNQAVVDISRSLGIPIIATNGVSYARPEERELLDAFTSISKQKSCSKNKKLDVCYAVRGELILRRVVRGPDDDVYSIND